MGACLERGLSTNAGVATSAYVAFGCKFFDYDNDGWLDIIVTNGHVQDNIEQINPAVKYRQSAVLLHNNGTPPIRFEEATHTVGDDLSKLIVGRGLAVGDIDNDGKMDILIVDAEGSPLLLHNDSTNTNHWLGLILEGTKSNRDAYGATITIEIAGKKQIRYVQSTGSYLSASDRRINFGLGSATSVERMTIRWPNGKIATVDNPKVDAYTTITENR